MASSCINLSTCSQYCVEILNETNSYKSLRSRADTKTGYKINKQHWQRLIFTHWQINK